MDILAYILAKSAGASKLNKNIGPENVGKTLIADENGNLQPGEAGGLPDVSEEDNGKVLGVANGEWGIRDLHSEYATIQYVNEIVGDIESILETI